MGMGACLLLPCCMPAIVHSSSRVKGKYSAFIHLLFYSFSPSISARGTVSIDCCQSLVYFQVSIQVVKCLPSLNLFLLTPVLFYCSLIATAKQIQPCYLERM